MGRMAHYRIINAVGPPYVGAEWGEHLRCIRNRIRGLPYFLLGNFHPTCLNMRKNDAPLEFGPMKEKPFQGTEFRDKSAK
jgi:hypothetical protein